MQTIEEKLRHKGLQVTAQRVAIYNYIKDHGHQSLHQIESAMQAALPSITSATIYNTLNTFVENGILKELKFPHTRKMIYDHNMDDHYHFMDEESGKIIDIPTHQLKIDSTLDESFVINQFDVLIKGKLKHT